MLIKYILIGPICAVLSFIILLSLGIGGIPSATLSWVIGSISIIVLAVADAFKADDVGDDYSAKAHETRDTYMS